MNMVIGNGVIANRFIDYKLQSKYLIFAGSINNSTIQNEEEILKEEESVNNALLKHPDITFIYFSTCSILDTSVSGTAYVKHKIRMERIIRKSAKEGISLIEFKEKLTNYLESDELKNYFNLEENKKIILFGKSMNSIDLPFLTRDLGWSYLRSFFSHQVLDLSSIVMAFIDMDLLPDDCISGSSLMNYFGMGDVAHTALEDAVNTAQLYLNMTELKQLRD